MAKKLVIVKVNTKTRNAVKITVDHNPEALRKIVGDRTLAGKDIALDDGKILRLVCRTAPADDDVRWTFEGNGFASFGGWVRGDAAFVGYDPTANARGEPGVTDVPVDAAFINARIRWFNPATDHVGPFVTEHEPGTLAYAEAYHAHMTDPAPQAGETVAQARARADAYRGHDDDGLPID